MTTTFDDVLSHSVPQNPFSDPAKWSLRAMLAALENTVLGSGDGFVEELFPALMAAGFDTRLTLHVLFDIEHGSDESCSAEVLCLDRQPVLLFKRIGDRSSYDEGLDILHCEHAKTLLRVLVELRAEQAFAKMTESAASSTPEALLWADVQYLTPLTTGVFFVGSPKWALGFGHVLNTHQGWLVRADGRLIRVRKFVRWVNDKPSYSSASDTHMAVFDTDDGLVETDARNVLLTLVEAPPELASLAKAIAQPAHWEVRPEEPTGRSDVIFVWVDQHLPEQTFTRVSCLAFAGPATLEAFTKAFPPGRQHAGVFSIDMAEMADHRRALVKELSTFNKA
jgi:hypothetical protein